MVIVKIEKKLFQRFELSAQVFVCFFCRWLKTYVSLFLIMSPFNIPEMHIKLSFWLITFYMYFFLFLGKLLYGFCGISTFSHACFTIQPIIFSSSDKHFSALLWLLNTSLFQFSSQPDYKAKCFLFKIESQIYCTQDENKANYSK